ncbi:MAG TPA: winged helix-turn-helix domain-containing protein [Acidimicrobiia bacterium]|nr:winged helix-turn-helix domain-containing protein [Acidimicrobiia bacterium]
MADHSVPDYDFEETLKLDSPQQWRALFEETRRRILHLLGERAATVTELAETLGVPKGTIGHHMGRLETAGLVRVVRTKKVRAIEAKYYGRTARTFLLTSTAEADFELAPDWFLSLASAELARASEREEAEKSTMSTLRYARIPSERAEAWVTRLGELAREFVTEERGGDVTYGLLLAFYPSDHPHLPDPAPTP